jgi:hypothetical protein
VEEGKGKDEDEGMRWDDTSSGNMAWCIGVSRIWEICICYVLVVVHRTTLEYTVVSLHNILSRPCPPFCH